MCQCRFINCNKWTTLWGTLIPGKAMQVWGQRAFRKSLKLLNFAVNLKNAFKKSLKNKQQQKVIVLSSICDVSFFSFCFQDFLYFVFCYFFYDMFTAKFVLFLSTWDHQVCWIYKIMFPLNLNY